MSKFFEVKYNTIVEYYSLITNYPTYNFFTAFGRLYDESFNECCEDYVFSIATRGSILLQTIKHIDNKDKIRQNLFTYFNEFKNEYENICNMRILNEIEMDWLKKEFDYLLKIFK